MKTGSASKNDAFATSDQSMVCGVITSRKRQKSKRVHLKDLLQLLD